jgi:hypothetical protein
VRPPPPEHQPGHAADAEDPEQVAGGEVAVHGHGPGEHAQEPLGPAGGPGPPAAVAAQRGLAGHRWPPGFPVRVRMGLHTGEGALGGDDYSGIDVAQRAWEAGRRSGPVLSPVEPGYPRGP